MQNYTYDIGKSKGEHKSNTYIFTNLPDTLRKIQDWVDINGVMQLEKISIDCNPTAWELTIYYWGDKQLF
jgi:hypothetical protein